MKINTRQLYAQGNGKVNRIHWKEDAFKAVGGRMDKIMERQLKRLNKKEERALRRVNKSILGKAIEHVDDKIPPGLRDKLRL